MAWTDAQKAAIDSRQGNFLVSAGAGSGKTAVLTERIGNIIASNEAKISEFLVLTFSNKAAHEMKTRIRKKLAEKNLIEASEEVERADITTFDAFARKIVVKYHDKVLLNIDDEKALRSIREDFDIIDENYLSIIKREILEERFEDYVKEIDVAKEMVEEYCLKNMDPIIDLILKVQALADKTSDRDAFYKSLIARTQDDGFIDSCLSEAYSNIDEHLKAASDLTALYPDGDYAGFDSEFLSGVIGLGSYDDLYNELVYRAENKVTFKRAGKGMDPDTKALRSKVSEMYKAYAELIIHLGNSVSQRERLKSFTEYAAFIAAVSSALDKDVLLHKYESSCWTFGDIFSMACQLVKDDEIRTKLATQYKFIMLDEYQDTNALQEEFIQSIASNNVFAVGDIKQSIYRFRNAEPSIFSNKFDKYDRGEGGTLIRLQDNFRSRKEVVDDINKLFGACMTKSLGGVDYLNGHKFNWGNKALYESTCSDEHNLEILSYNPDAKGLKQDEKEAMVIAKDIINKVESGYEVLGKNGMRPCTPSDFAILISRKSRFDVYKKVFSEAKIPLAVSSDSDLSSEDVSMAFESLLMLLKYIDNEDPIAFERVKFAYVSLMRSYLINASDEEIYKTIKENAVYSSPLVSGLKSIKPSLLKMTIGDATRELLHYLPFVDNLPMIGNVINNFEKIKAIEDVANGLDKLVGNIEHFYDYFDNLEHYGLKLKIKESGESGEGVQLMSIHASKGLEFPIIYCPDLARRVNKDDASGAFLVDETFGLALPRGKSDEYPTSVLHYLISQNTGADAQDEFLRLFYVDLTRAKEKIILVTKEDKEVAFTRINSWQVLKTKTKKIDEETTKTSYSIRSADSFLQYLAISDIHDFKITRVNVEEPGVLKASLINSIDLPSPTFKSISIPPIIKDRVKASKSTITPVDEGALAYGTRLHRLMELVDLKTKDVSFIRSDKEREIISRAINLPEFPPVDDAKIFHEYAFYEKEMNVHGSIDLLLVYKDHAYVIDYKTRHIDDPEYEKQLSVYKSYVEKTFKLKCSTALLSIMEGAIKVVE